MKILTLGVRLLALVAMLIFIQSCDLEDLTDKDDDDDKEVFFVGSLPSKFTGGWYDDTGNLTFDIGSEDSEHYIGISPGIYYVYDEYQIIDDVYKVIGTPDSGSDKTFYIKESDTIGEIEISQVSATSGFANYTDTAPVTVSAPVANFSASDQTIEEGESVTFTNTSTGDGSYSWVFEGGSPSSSSSENPTVTYNTPGKYDVKLTVTNSAGTDIETKTDHITVTATSVMRGFAWCGSSTTASYTPSTGYSYNSEGGAITVTRSTTGSYAVKFGGMAMTNGHVQAALYGGSEGAVRVLSWSNSGNDLVANIRTFDKDANLADRAFNIYVTGTGFEGAYLYADQETAGSYTPNTAKSYNSSGSAPTISSPSVGTYTVTIPGVGAGNLGNVQVTAASTVSAIAKIKEWTISGSDLKVEVRTYHSGTGALKDAEFNLLYTKNLTDIKGGYCWADLESSTSTYTPFRNGNTGSGNITSKKTSTGTYEVIVPNQAGSGNTILTTTYGDNNYKAVVGGWSTQGSDLRVTVYTYNSSGVATDAEFSFFTIYKD
ncbi:MAG: PKD domain-containing protein [Reichenbachiella sp.]|uniref:PKD domain-containing protein n=1 Tax=Reichenbachiella sp. TaxID=2184521 RepID=UPI002967200E|nr:PKD domain-containing protein [Reichenbachiella sp.]MDW3209335.1 PKD domain-containing protein [Reichenbachiella sp.]